jgi:sulfur-carrier protein adenylyltransferase/sulfurtransferase
VTRAPRFALTGEPLQPGELAQALKDPACGGYASFEGWVRDENEGRRVLRLDYEAYQELAVAEGERILDEAIARFGLRDVRCQHRLGELAIGDLAVWVGAAAAHRGEAFLGCRYVIDEVKHRLPIWKKEHYQDGDSGWVNCERCAEAAHENARSHGSVGHAHRHAAQPQVEARAGAADYSRQMQLPEVGTSGQARLRRARVLVIGAGGLGVPVMTYLAGAGVGVLGVMDGDRLEASNLHRQPLYRRSDVGQPKAELAATALRALNPEIEVRAYVERANRDRLTELATGFDLLIDCSDNFATKFLVNDVAVASGRPAVLASIYQYEGQLQLVRPEEHSSCLRCIWPEATRDGLVGNCAEAGVLGPVPGVLGALQALEALKVLLGLSGALKDEVLLVDLLAHTVRRVRAARAPECAGACLRVPAAASTSEDYELAFGSLAAAGAAGYLVVDIREPEESRQVPAAGATLTIPVADLLAHHERLPADLDCLLLCARGARSRAAAATLRARGVRRVWSFRGGLAALGR